MEELFSPKDDDGESSAFSIKELIHLGRLPLVVKKCAAPPGQTGKIEDVGFPDDEEILLDRVTDVQMMEIKVGPFVNDERRHRWRGDRYLIPAGFPGKLKFTVRPWSRQKFITIKEVIHSLPRLVKVECTLHSDSFGDYRSIEIPVESVLQLEHVFTPVGRKERYAIFKGEHRYLLKETRIVKMTLVPDTRLYTLQNLKGSLSLPMWVQFERILPGQLACSEDYDFQKTLEILSKPVNLICFKTVTLTVAWSNRNWNCVKCAVVSPGTPEIRMLKVVPCAAESERHMKVLGDELLIRNGLYLLSQNTHEMTWLHKTRRRSSSIGKRALDIAKPMANVKPMGCMKKSASLQCLSDGPQTHSQPERNNPRRKGVAYSNLTAEVVRPGTPRQISFPADLHLKKTHPCSQHSSSKQALPLRTLPWSYLSAIADVSEDEEEHIYEDLFHLAGDNTLETPVKTHSIGHRYINVRGGTSEMEQPKVIVKPRGNLRKAASMQCLIEDDDSPVKSKCVSTLKRENTDSDQSLRRSFKNLLKSKLQWPSVFGKSPFRKSASQSEKVTVDPKVRRPLSLPVVQSSDEDSVYMYDQAYGGMATNSFRNFVEPQASTQPFESARQSMASRNDFFDYSVQEVVDCFTRCSLNKLANFCKKEKLDGRFFENFDMDKLKEEPLNLENFTLIKVKRIIFDGWRPKC